jgi:Ser/Thr protein kinase RdoA (MazF antagonist)
VIATFRSLVDPEALAAVIDTAYGIRVRSCVLLRSLVNDVYRIETADGRFAFKLYRTGHRTLDEVGWEVQVAAAAGPVLVHGVRLADGSAAGQIQTAEGVRPYSLWHWAGGHKPEPPFSDDLFRRYGAGTAAFHAACDKADLPPRRFDVMAALEWPLDEVLDRVGPDDRAIFSRLVAAARAGLSDLELDHGICHGDVSLDNLHSDAGRVVFYDLDRAGNGWRAADLTGVSTTTGFATFLAGYRSVRPFGDGDLAAIPWLSVVDLIGNLHFHLVDKPKLRGVESIGEGWAERERQALRAAAVRLLG